MPVLVPDTIDAACEALAAHPGAALIAGGTDLMVGVNAGRVRPEHVIAVGRLPGLRGWRRHGDHVVIGAGTTYTDCLDPALGELLPVLAQAARSVGSPQIRNAGTLGGNLGTASPAGDGTTALVAAGGTVVLRSVDGEREVGLEGFVTGVRTTRRRPDELIVAVRVPVAAGPQEFLKVGPRNAMVIAVASLALVRTSDRRVRAALGSVGPVPVLVESAGDDVDSFVEAVRAAVRPIDDHRSTAEYRRHAAGVLARRAFERTAR